MFFKKQSDNTRQIILLIYVIFLILGTAYYIFIKATGMTIPCFYYTLTGKQCPGCGVTRMFLALADLELAAAFRYNPVMFVLMPLRGIISVLAFIGKPVFFRNLY